jgi:hypothetical protein
MNFSKHLKYNNAVLIPKNKKSRKRMKNFKVTFYCLEPERIELLRFAKRIHKKGKILMDPIEICQLATIVKNTSKIKGDIAEVGVYKGGSAKVISKYKKNKKLHLIDTFKGLPKGQGQDKNVISKVTYTKGQYKADIDSVKKMLSKYNNIQIYKSRFPENSQKLKKKCFSLVHLDLDIYQSTYDCLSFFYKRMTKGGIIITHDYQNSSGVRKAFDSFFLDKPETIIELAGTQALIVKI